MRLYVFYHYGHYVYQGTRCETKQGRQQQRLENTSNVETPAWIAPPLRSLREKIIKQGRRLPSSRDLLGRFVT